MDKGKIFLKKEKNALKKENRAGRKEYRKQPFPAAQESCPRKRARSLFILIRSKSDGIRAKKGAEPKAP